MSEQAKAPWEDQRPPTAHTLGPWTASVNRYGRYEFTGPEEDMLVGVFDPYDDGRGPANIALIESAAELKWALTRLVQIIDAAGLSNLSKGVQLGQISWHVKADEALTYSRDVLAKAKAERDA